MHLSVVAVSRNDTHGGDMLGRMQHFVDGFIAQCRRHALEAELILVEWNPPSDRAPLKDALKWPADFGPAEVRIVTVPPDVHGRFPHSEDLPLFQMIGKNVGIRRARGQYVLATNIDILLDDAVVEYLRDRLRPGIMLRADRYDVPADLPKNAPFERVLADCRKRFTQVNTRNGIFDVEKRRLLGMTTRVEAAVMAFKHAWRILGTPPRPPATRGQVLAARLGIFLDVLAALVRRVGRRAIQDLRGPLRSLPFRVVRLAAKFVLGVLLFGARVLRYLAKRARGFVRRAAADEASVEAMQRFHRSRWLHTLACGDFTLMAREDWFKLRAYPEWPIYSWHIDSAFMYAANANGIREEALGPQYRIYHIDHSAGSGWSPQGAELLFSRLRERGIPYMSDERLAEWQHSVADNPAAAIVNGPDWGIADVDLPDQRVVPTDKERAPLPGVGAGEDKKSGASISA